MMLLHKQGAPALLLPEFLREIFLGRRTGLLHVTHDEATIVSFRAVSGELVSGSSSDTRGRLGETMVRRGLISSTDLDRALAIVSGRRRRLAPVLRELELVDTHGLEQALVLHVQELLVTALLWDQAVLLFEDQELPDASPEDVALRCWMADLILEVVRQIPRRRERAQGPRRRRPSDRVGREPAVRHRAHHAQRGRRLPAGVRRRRDVGAHGDRVRPAAGRGRRAQPAGLAVHGDRALLPAPLAKASEPRLPRGSGS